MYHWHKIHESQLRHRDDIPVLGVLNIGMKLLVLLLVSLQGVPTHPDVVDIQLHQARFVSEGLQLLEPFRLLFLHKGVIVEELLIFVLLGARGWKLVPIICSAFLIWFVFFFLGLWSRHWHGYPKRNSESRIFGRGLWKFRVADRFTHEYSWYYSDPEYALVVSIDKKNNLGW